MKEIRKELEDNFDKIELLFNDKYLDYTTIYFILPIDNSIQLCWENSDRFGKRYFIITKDDYQPNYYRYKLRNPKTWWIKRIIKRLIKKYK